MKVYLTARQLDDKGRVTKNIHWLVEDIEILDDIKKDIELLLAVGVVQHNRRVNKKSLTELDFQPFTERAWVPDDFRTVLLVKPTTTENITYVRLPKLCVAHHHALYFNIGISDNKRFINHVKINGDTCRLDYTDFEKWDDPAYAYRDEQSLRNRYFIESNRV